MQDTSYVGSYSQVTPLHIPSQGGKYQNVAGNCVLLCRAVARNMDSEAMETSIREATAAVRENVSSLERSLLDLEDYSRWVTYQGIMCLHLYQQPA